MKKKINAQIPEGRDVIGYPTWGDGVFNLGILNEDVNSFGVSEMVITSISFLFEFPPLWQSSVETFAAVTDLVLSLDEVDLVLQRRSVGVADSLLHFFNSSSSLERLEISSFCLTDAASSLTMWFFNSSISLSLSVLEVCSSSTFLTSASILSFAFSSSPRFRLNCSVMSFSSWLYWFQMKLFSATRAEISLLFLEESCWFSTFSLLNSLSNDFLFFFFSSSLLSALLVIPCKNK